MSECSSVDQSRMDGWMDDWLDGGRMQDSLRICTILVGGGEERKKKARSSRLSGRDLWRRRSSLR